ncbi:MAG: hypothetical protein WC351_04665, partial [Candidatus Izemoplasmatales bacterium]
MKEPRIKNIITIILENMMRISAFFFAVMMFLPTLNPVRITILINKTMSLFTSAVSYNKLTSEAIRAMNNGWVFKSDFVILNLSAIIICLGVLVLTVGACFSIGNEKFKRLSSVMTLSGSLVQFFGFGGIYIDYSRMLMTSNPARVMPAIPMG